MGKIEKKLLAWYLLDLPLDGHIIVVDKILVALYHCLFPSKVAYKGLEGFLWSFLWGKQCKAMDGLWQLETFVPYLVLKVVWTFLMSKPNGWPLQENG